MEDYSQKLINYRKENNLTEKDLAKKICVRENDIIYWEKEISFPTAEEIILIEKFFNENRNVNNNECMTYGNMLLNRRKELNLSKKDLANSLGINIFKLSKWEEDLEEPNNEEKKLIDSYLKTEIIGVKSEDTIKTSQYHDDLLLIEESFEDHEDRKNIKRRKKIKLIVFFLILTTYIATVVVAFLNYLGSLYFLSFIFFPFSVASMFFPYAIVDWGLDIKYHFIEDFKPETSEFLVWFTRIMGFFIFIMSLVWLFIN